MIQITPHMRILVAIEPIDFRAGIDGLAAACRKRLEADPFRACATRPSLEKQSVPRSRSSTPPADRSTHTKVIDDEYEYGLPEWEVPLNG
jgi:hypothetical protein